MAGWPRAAARSENGNGSSGAIFNDMCSLVAPIVLGSVQGIRVRCAVRHRRRNKYRVSFHPLTGTREGITMMTNTV